MASLSKEGFRPFPANVGRSTLAADDHIKSGGTMPLLPVINCSPATLARLGASLAAALTLSIMPWVPAHAGTTTFTDPAADSTFVDIGRVEIAYGRRLHVKVEHRTPIAIGQDYAFWIDTVRRNPGPEYFIEFAPNSGLGAIRRVTSFTDPTTPRVTCNYSARADKFTQGPVELWIPGGCLRSPRQARVSVRFQQRTDINWVDWAPGFRRFSAWVPRY